MTTKQTIDGVPRELTPEMLDELTNGDQSKRAVMKLRWASLVALLDAEQPAPVAVVRCSFCDVTDQEGNPWSGGSATQDGILIYRVMGCKDHKHLADACLAEVTRLNPSL